MKKLLFTITIFSFAQGVFAQSDSTLKHFVGNYVFAAGSVIPEVTVELVGENLSMISTAGTSSLEKLGVDSFQIVEFSGYAAFKRGAENKVKAVHIEAGGYVLDGVKAEQNGWAFTYYQKPNAVLTERR